MSSIDDFNTAVSQYLNSAESQNIPILQLINNIKSLADAHNLILLPVDYQVGVQATSGILEVEVGSDFDLNPYASIAVLWKGNGLQFSGSDGIGIGVVTEYVNSPFVSANFVTSIIGDGVTFNLSGHLAGPISPIATASISVVDRVNELEVGFKLELNKEMVSRNIVSDFSSYDQGEEYTKIYNEARAAKIQAIETGTEFDMDLFLAVKEYEYNPDRELNTGSYSVSSRAVDILDNGDALVIDSVVSGGYRIFTLRRVSNGVVQEEASYTMNTASGRINGMTAEQSSEYIGKLYDEISEEEENKDQECFSAGTPIDMADGTQKPIETIEIGDEVLAYDPFENNGLGGLRAARVTQTMVNQVPEILDFHGLKVTPGHATLCGDGPHKGRHVPLMDILLADGAIVDREGNLIRAATNLPVDSERDQFIEVAYITSKSQKTYFKGRMRAGTLMLNDEGGSWRVLDSLKEEGYRIEPNGLIAKDGEAPHPLYWAGELPNPADYVLKKSGLSVADLYSAEGRELEAPSTSSKIGANLGSVYAGMTVN